MIRTLCLAVGLGGCWLHAHALTLPAALSLVLQAHPEVRMQEMNVRVAEQDTAIARQQFLPTPSVSLEQAQAGSGDVQYQGADRVTYLRLQQPLWTGGRLTAGLDKAQSQVKMRQAMLDEARLQLAVQTVQAWGDWCAALARVAAVDRNLQQHRELLARVARRVEEGAASQAEWVMTDGRVAQVQAQLRTQQSQVHAALNRLIQLLGQPVTETQPSFEPLALPLPSDMAQLSQQSLDNSPTLARLRAQLEIVEQEVKERQADTVPEVYLRAEHQRGNFSMANTPNTNRLFVGLTSRFGAGLSSFKQVDAALRRKEAAGFEIDSNQRKLEEQVQTLWIQLQDIEARLPSLARNLSANQATMEAWDRQFLAGRKSWLDVMNAARELMQAEMDMADARVNQQSLQWRLALWAHGPEPLLSQVQPR